MGRIGLAVGVLVSLCAHVEAQQMPCSSARLEYGRADVAVDRDSTDTTPPAMPQITQILASSHREASDRIDIEGAFDPDTARIRVTNSTGYSLETTPDQLHVCSNTALLQANERFTIVAYDKAGNASEPFTSGEVLTAGGYVKREHHYKCGTGAVMLLLGSIVIGGGIFLVLVVLGFMRKRAPTTVAGEFVSPILAENVARVVARGYAIKVAIAVLTTTALWTLDHPFMAVMSGPFALVWFLEVMVTRGALRQFDKPIQRLEKRENWIYINSAKLYAPDRAWAKASALPSASVLD